jgi:ribosomal protein S18 acetylase RimI-like enzyme
MNLPVPLRVELIEGINSTPAAELAVRGWLENVENGLSDGELNMGANLNAFVGYAQNGRDVLPVGVITWDVDAARIWVHQSYVLPEFRGRGVYSAMWNELVGHAQGLPNVRSIQSATHVNNKAMRTIAARQGRRETGVILKVDILR